MKKFINIKVNKEIADMLHIYCKLNNVKMLDFANKIFEEKFKGFKEQIKELNKFKVDE